MKAAHLAENSDVSHICHEMRQQEVSTGGISVQVLDLFDCSVSIVVMLVLIEGAKANVNVHFL